MSTHNRLTAVELHAVLEAIGFRLAGDTSDLSLREVAALHRAQAKLTEQLERYEYESTD